MLKRQTSLSADVFASKNYPERKNDATTACKVCHNILHKHFTRWVGRKRGEIKEIM
jgi:hypothetical protein